MKTNFRRTLEIKNKVSQLKKEKSAYKIYVDDRYENPVMIPLYNEVQVKFMKEVLQGWSIYSSLLIKLFETKSDDLEYLRSAYSNMIDFDD